MIRNLINKLMGKKQKPKLKGPNDESIGTNAGLTVRAVNCLHKNNIFTHAQLREYVRDNDLRRLRGIGDVTQGDIHKYLTSKVKELDTAILGDTNMKSWA